MSAHETLCPRWQYQNASLDWYQHLRDCDTCQAASLSNKGSLCSEGDLYFEKEMAAYLAQNDAGCNTLTCPGKDLELRACPGIAEGSNAS